MSDTGADQDSNAEEQGRCEAPAKRGRDENRSLMPTVAAFVDGIREWAPGAKVHFAVEGVVVRGKSKEWH